jgi:copper chaperone NosL
MKHNSLTAATRILLVLCSVALIAVLYVPMWRIDLDAPQYPEGLKLLIYAKKIGGNVDIINGLNHYIGMKTLHDADFIEFAILPYIIIFFTVAFILTALMAKRRVLNLLFVLFVLFGVVAMVDFWRWEYNYGHNLNPDAAIIVPGMAYQPPLIGYKQLLNFGAYSMPDIGGWIFIAVGTLLLGAVVLEWRRSRKLNRSNKVVVAAAWLSMILFLSSCNTKPEPIQVGRDNCSFCKMTISDNRFGAELVTQKGKIYKFDDIHCLVSFLHTENGVKKDKAAVYFTDFSNGHVLIKEGDAVFCKSDLFKTPMGGNIAAFSNTDSIKKVAAHYSGSMVLWEEISR